jgi:putative aldouronate transport system substrate-binding protein
MQRISRLERKEKVGMGIKIRIVLYFLAITLGLSLMTSCRRGEQSDIPTLTIALPFNPLVEDYKTNWLTLFIEEQNNVNLEFMFLPTNQDDAISRLTMMIASGTKLPDIIMMQLPEMVVYEFARAGVILDITDFYYNPDVTVNINKLSEKDSIMSNMRMPDGKIYAIPSYINMPTTETAYRFWIKEDWLSVLNLSMPRTTEDFYHVLKAFVENDPNENGRRDEIGLIGSLNGWATDPIPFLMNAFLYANPDKNYLNVENGKIYASFIQPEWKDGIEYINRLYSSGLLATESFTQDISQLRGLLNREEHIIGVVASGSRGVFNWGDHMVLMPPLIGPLGKSYTPFNPSIPFGCWFVTTSSQNAEIAVRVGDFFLNDDISMIASVGPYGEYWTRDPEVLLDWVGIFQDEPYFVETGEPLSGIPNNVIWQFGHPKIERWEFWRGQPLMLRSEYEMNPVYPPERKILEYYSPRTPNEFIGRLIYTPEEISEISILQASIKHHVDTALVEFIVGIRPLNTFNGYMDFPRILGQCVKPQC